MFAYCNNNPVIYQDPTGEAVDTVFDVVSLAFSVAEVAANPGDPWAWAGLSGDLVDVLLPFVGGVGEAIKGLKAAGYADEVAEAVTTLATTGSAASRGRRGEILADILSGKGKSIININNRVRIPDRLTNGVLSEVKNVAYISNTQQLRDFADYAQTVGASLELYVRPTTKVAKTVIDAGWDVKTLW